MGNISVSDTANDSANVAYVTQRPAATRPAATNTSIADALFSGVQQRVIGLLFGEPERSFYSNEIVRRVASGRGALQRELERLTQAGLELSIPLGRVVKLNLRMQAGYGFHTDLTYDHLTPTSAPSGDVASVRPLDMGSANLSGATFGFTAGVAF